MKDTIFKSWKTTLVGVLIIGYYGYKAVILKEQIDISELVAGLTAVGFILSKDGDKTHS